MRTVAVSNLLALAAFFVASPAFAQTNASASQPARTAIPPAYSQPITSTADLRDTLANVQSALDTIRADRWKAKDVTRGEIQNNIVSIRKDMQTTLPTLLQKVDATPSSLAASFAVYRNFSALYDVILRLKDQASRYGPLIDSDQLGTALEKLEQGRTQLGTNLLNAAAQQEMTMTNLRTALVQAQTPPPSAAPQHVVTDEAAPKPKPRHKRTPPPAPSSPTTQASRTNPSGSKPSASTNTAAAQ